MVLLVTGGCASVPAGQVASIADVAPMLSVERFLQAANTRDLDAMARMFGNADGPIAERASNPFVCAFKRMGSWIGLGEPCSSRLEIELRMNAIALIIQHDDYTVRGESSVTGRSRPTTRVSVDLVRGNERFVDVPFVVVQTSNGRWLVEEIGLERMTAMRRLPLDQLPEYFSRAVGVNEGNQVAACPELRLLVDESDTLFA